MNYNIRYPATMDRQNFSKFQVNVRENKKYKPVENATVAIKKSGTDAQTIETLDTDISGQTITVELEAPPRELSEEPQELRPYAEYTVEVTKDGYEPSIIEGSQILADTKSIQDVRLEELAETVETSINRRYNNYRNRGYRNNRQLNVISVQPHTLYGEYPAKIPEDEVKKLPFEKEGIIVLPEVVVPEIIVVHDGTPDDKNAPNYYVGFKDYITNVCSSEIYATWPEACITSNILAILSFTLNRVYSEWYRAKGYDFTITSSTAYDQKYIYGRNYYDNIQSIVDQIFANYITKPGIKQPLFAQYCDGVQVQCPGWMTQWGSKEKADQGQSAIEILRSFYGSDIYIETAEQVSGIPASWPGANLEVGSSGNNVRVIQEQLNAISNNYPAIPKIKVDGSFGSGTEEAVEVFQSVFGLPANGIVDYPTWYKISDIFVAVTRLSELN